MPRQLTTGPFVEVPRYLPQVGDPPTRLRILEGQTSPSGIMTVALAIEGEDGVRFWFNVPRYVIQKMSQINYRFNLQDHDLILRVFRVANAHNRKIIEIEPAVTNPNTRLF